MTHPALSASLAEAELVEAEMEITGRLVEASNATFLTEVRTPAGATSPKGVVTTMS